MVVASGGYYSVCINLLRVGQPAMVKGNPQQIKQTNLWCKFKSWYAIGGNTISSHVTADHHVHIHTLLKNSIVITFTKLITTVSWICLEGTGVYYTAQYQPQSPITSINFNSNNRESSSLVSAYRVHSNWLYLLYRSISNNFRSDVLGDKPFTMVLTNMRYL